MTSSDLLNLFRAEMRDAATPYLWGDTEFFGYLDEAQTRFCRDTSGIADARTPAVTKLNLVPGTDWYATDNSILNVRKITRADTGLPVRMLTAEQADQANVVFLATLTGPLKAVVLGIEPHAVRVTPMPDATSGVLTVSSAITALGASVVLLASTTSIVAGMGLTAVGVPVGTTVLSVVANTSVTLSAAVTAAMPLGAALAFGTVLNLSVYRKPLVTITDDGDQALEIGAEHHSALLYWVKHRAYDKQDSEGSDMKKSTEFKTRFDAYCAKAKEEEIRARRVQGNVAYGGL